MTNKEFKNSAPILASLKDKETGFKVPSSYFKSVESTVLSKLSEVIHVEKSTFILPESYLMQDEKSFISKLDNLVISKQNQKIPKGYFDSIEDNIFEKLSKEKENKTRSIRRYWIPAAIAASIILLFSIYNPFFITQNKEFAEVSSWIEDGHLDLDSYQIADYYESDLESLEIEDLINTETLEDYIKDELTEEAFYN